MNSPKHTSTPIKTEITDKIGISLSPKISSDFFQNFESSSSLKSPCFSTLILQAFISVDKEVTKFTLPLTNGIFYTTERFPAWPTSHSSTSMLPSGSLHAIAALSMPLIIIPSISACPPIFDLNFSFGFLLFIWFFPFFYYNLRLILLLLPREGSWQPLSHSLLAHNIKRSAVHCHNFVCNGLGPIPEPWRVWFALKNLVLIFGRSVGEIP